MTWIYGQKRLCGGCGKLEFKGIVSIGMMDFAQVHFCCIGSAPVMLERVLPAANISSCKI